MDIRTEIGGGGGASMVSAYRSAVSAALHRSCRAAPSADSTNASSSSSSSLSSSSSSSVPSSSESSPPPCKSRYCRSSSSSPLKNRSYTSHGSQSKTSFSRCDSLFASALYPPSSNTRWRSESRSTRYAMVTFWNFCTSCANRVVSESNRVSERSLGERSSSAVLSSRSRCFARAISAARSNASGPATAASARAFASAAASAAAARRSRNAAYAATSYLGRSRPRSVKLSIAVKSFFGSSTLVSSPNLLPPPGRFRNSRWKQGGHKSRRRFRKSA